MELFTVGEGESNVAFDITGAAVANLEHWGRNRH
jgi:hypothetical protein